MEDDECSTAKRTSARGSRPAAIHKDACTPCSAGRPNASSLRPFARLRGGSCAVLCSPAAAAAAAAARGTLGVPAHRLGSSTALARNRRHARAEQLHAAPRFPEHAANRPTVPSSADCRMGAVIARDFWASKRPTSRARAGHRHRGPEPTHKLEQTRCSSTSSASPPRPPPPSPARDQQGPPPDRSAIAVAGAFMSRRANAVAEETRPRSEVLSSSERASCGSTGNYALRHKGQPAA